MARGREHRGPHAGQSRTLDDSHGGKAGHEPLGQLAPQQVERAHQLRAHGARRPRQPFGDLLGVEALFQVELQHLAIGSAELLTDHAHRRLEFACGRFDLGVDHEVLLRPERGGPAPLTPLLARLVAQQAHQPRQHGFAMTELRARLDRLQERALQQILGVVAAARQPERHAHQPVGSRIEHVAERIRIAGAAEVREAAVGLVAAGCHPSE